MAYLHSAFWFTLLAIVWTIALWGFFSKVFFAHRIESVSMWPCIVLGCIPFVSVPALIGVVSFTGFMVDAAWHRLLYARPRILD